jgi:hypothetical protein
MYILFYVDMGIAWRNSCTKTIGRLVPKLILLLGQIGNSLIYV